MLDKKLMELCGRNGVEKDPKKLIKIITALTRPLNEEQDAIKGKICASLSKTVGPPE